MLICHNQFKIQVRASMGLFGKSEEQEDFNRSHGRYVNGKLYTYQELQSSSNVKQCFFGLFIFVVFVFCLVSLYQVDYKHRDQQYVIHKIKQLPNSSFHQIINESIEATNQLKDAAFSVISNNSIDSLDLQNWIGGQLAKLSNATNQSGALEYVLNLPVVFKNWIVKQIWNEGEQPQKPIEKPTSSENQETITVTTSNKQQKVQKSSSASTVQTTVTSKGDDKTKQS